MKRLILGSAIFGGLTVGSAVMPASAFDALPVSYQTTTTTGPISVTLTLQNLTGTTGDVAQTFSNVNVDGNGTFTVILDADAWKALNFSNVTYNTSIEIAIGSNKYYVPLLDLLRARAKAQSAQYFGDGHFNKLYLANSGTTGQVIVRGSDGELTWGSASPTSSTTGTFGTEGAGSTAGNVTVTGGETTANKIVLDGVTGTISGKDVTASGAIKGQTLGIGGTDNGNFTVDANGTVNSKSTVTATGFVSGENSSGKAGVITVKGETSADDVTISGGVVTAKSFSGNATTATTAATATTLANTKAAGESAIAAINNGATTTTISAGKITAGSKGKILVSDGDPTVTAQWQDPKTVLGNFAVTDSDNNFSANQTIGGTAAADNKNLTVNGTVTASGKSNLNGGINVNSGKLTVDTYGNVATSGDIIVNTDKLTVTATNGNVVSKGDISGVNITATGALKGNTVANTANSFSVGSNGGVQAVSLNTTEGITAAGNVSGANITASGTSGRVTTPKLFVGSGNQAGKILIGGADGEATWGSLGGSVLDNESVALSKLESGTAGYIPVAQGTGVYTAYKEVTGDVTMNKDGATTISAGVVTSAKIAAQAGITATQLAAGGENKVLAGGATYDRNAWTSDLNLGNNGTVTAKTFTGTLAGTADKANDLTASATSGNSVITAINSTAAADPKINANRLDIKGLTADQAAAVTTGAGNSVISAINNATESGTIDIAKLNSNIAVENADNTFSANNTFSKTITSTVGSGDAFISTNGNITLTNGTLTAQTISGTVAPSNIPLASSRILVGDGNGKAAAVAMSGDVTISNTGATAIQNTAGNNIVTAINNAATTNNSISKDKLPAKIAYTDAANIFSAAQTMNAGATIAGLTTSGTVKIPTGTAPTATGMVLTNNSTDGTLEWKTMSASLPKDVAGKVLTSTSATTDPVYSETVTLGYNDGTAHAGSLTVNDGKTTPDNYITISGLKGKINAVSTGTGINVTASLSDGIGGYGIVSTGDGTGGYGVWAKGTNGASALRADGAVVIGVNNSTKKITIAQPTKDSDIALNWPLLNGTLVTTSSTSVGINTVLNSTSSTLAPVYTSKIALGNSNGAGSVTLYNNTNSAKLLIDGGNGDIYSGYNSTTPTSSKAIISGTSGDITSVGTIKGANLTATNLVTTDKLKVGSPTAANQVLTSTAASDGTVKWTDLSALTGDYALKSAANAFTGNNTFGGTSTFNGVSTFNGNVTLGDASTDAVTVNATTTFKEPVSGTTASFGTSGTSDGSLTVNSATAGNTVTLAGSTGTVTAKAVTASGAVTAGSIETGTLKVTGGENKSSGQILVSTDGTGTAGWKNTTDISVGTATKVATVSGDENAVLTSNGTTSQWNKIINNNVDNNAAIEVGKLKGGTATNILVTDSNGKTAWSDNLSSLPKAAANQVLVSNGSANNSGFSSTVKLGTDITLNGTDGSISSTTLTTTGKAAANSLEVTTTSALKGAATIGTTDSPTTLTVTGATNAGNDIALNGSTGAVSAKAVNAADVTATGTVSTANLKVGDITKDQTGKILVGGAAGAATWNQNVVLGNDAESGFSGTITLHDGTNATTDNSVVIGGLEGTVTATGTIKGKSLKGQTLQLNDGKTNPSIVNFATPTTIGTVNLTLPTASGEIVAAARNATPTLDNDKVLQVVAGIPTWRETSYIIPNELVLGNNNENGKVGSILLHDGTNASTDNSVLLKGVDGSILATRNITVNNGVDNGNAINANASESNGTGVVGNATGTNGTGVKATAINGTGLLATGTTYGVKATATSGVGVDGESSSGIGVRAHGSATALQVEGPSVFTSIDGAKTITLSAPTATATIGFPTNIASGITNARLVAAPELSGSSNVGFVLSLDANNNPGWRVPTAAENSVYTGNIVNNEIRDEDIFSAANISVSKLSGGNQAGYVLQAVNVDGVIKPQWTAVTTTINAVTPSAGQAGNYLRVNSAGTGLEWTSLVIPNPLNVGTQSATNGQINVYSINNGNPSITLEGSSGTVSAYNVKTSNFRFTEDGNSITAGQVLTASSADGTAKWENAPSTVWKYTYGGSEDANTITAGTAGGMHITSAASETSEQTKSIFEAKTQGTYGVAISANATTVGEGIGLKANANGVNGTGIKADATGSNGIGIKVTATGETGKGIVINSTSTGVTATSTSGTAIEAYAANTTSGVGLYANGGNIGVRAVSPGAALYVSGRTVFESTQTKSGSTMYLTTIAKPTTSEDIDLVFPANDGALIAVGTAPSRLGSDNGKATTANPSTDNEKILQIDATGTPQWQSAAGIIPDALTLGKQAKPGSLTIAKANDNNDLKQSTISLNANKEELMLGSGKAGFSGDVIFNSTVAEKATTIAQPTNSADVALTLPTNAGNLVAAGAQPAARADAATPSTDAGKVLKVDENGTPQWVSSTNAITAPTGTAIVGDQGTGVTSTEAVTLGYNDGTTAHAGSLTLSDGAAEAKTSRIFMDGSKNRLILGTGDTQLGGGTDVKGYLFAGESGDDVRVNYITGSNVSVTGHQIGASFGYSNAGSTVTNGVYDWNIGANTTVNAGAIYVTSTQEGSTGASTLGIVKGPALTVTNGTTPEFYAGNTGNVYAAGNAVIGGTLNAGTTAVSALQVGTSTTEGYVLTADVSGNATWKAIGSSGIAADAVDNTKLADNAVQTENIKDGEVKTADIADLNVTNDKLAGNISSDKITSLDASKLTGTIDGVRIAAGTITNAMLAGSISSDKLAGSISAASQLTAGGAGNVLLGGATANNWGKITNAYIDANTIDGAKLTDATVASAKISGVISSDKLAGSAASGKVLTTNGTANSWTSLSDLTIGTASAVASTVTAGNSVVSALNATGEGVTGTIGKTRLPGDVVYTTSTGDISANASTATNLKNGTVLTASQIPSTVVYKDADADFGTHTVTAATFTGALNGNAATATTADKLKNDAAAGESAVDAINTQTTKTIAAAKIGTLTSTNLPSTVVYKDADADFGTHTVTAATFTGALSGNASTATNLTFDVANNGKVYVGGETANSWKSLSDLNVLTTSSNLDASKLTGTIDAARIPSITNDMLAGSIAPAKLTSATSGQVLGYSASGNAWIDASTLTVGTANNITSATTDEGKILTGTSTANTSTWKSPSDLNLVTTTGGKIPTSVYTGAVPAATGTLLLTSTDGTLGWTAQAAPTASEIATAINADANTNLINASKLTGTLPSTVYTGSAAPTDNKVLTATSAGVAWAAPTTTYTFVGTQGSISTVSSESSAAITDNSAANGTVHYIYIQGLPTQSISVYGTPTSSLTAGLYMFIYDGTNWHYAKISN